jgi:hypothetical protein
MGHRKLLAGVAIAAALGAGMTIGLFLGVPAISGAQATSPTSSPVPPGKGPRRVFGLQNPMSFGIVAKDLGMSTADLKKALVGGQSIAALARSKNVDPQKIVNDLVAGASSRIDAAVKAGKLNGTQAANLKSKLTAAVGAFVNGTGKGPGGFGRGPGGPFRLHGPGFPGPPGMRGRGPTATATPASV